MDNQNTKQSLHLAEEIIEEILSKLPVKSLLRFRSVSKSWLSLISSERFIKTHLQNSTKNTTFPHHRVIFNYDGLKQCSLHSLLNDSFTNPSTFDDPTYYSSRSARVVGCSDGLVCIIEKSRYFFLWNPSTKTSKKLPKIGHVNNSWYITGRGFGWDESGGDYKIFAVVCDPYQSMDKVYSSKTNSWKIVEHKDFDFEYHVGQFVRGKLHWLMSREYDIVYVYLKSEVFGMIEQPCTPQLQGCPWLGVLGGCLSMLCNGRKRCIDVWVMKKYGVKQSWEKLIALPHVLDLGPFPAPFGVGPNREIFLFYGSTFLVYNLQDNAFRRIHYFNKAHLYVESLTSVIDPLDLSVCTLTMSSKV